jgi:hypothetical protein
MLLTWLWGPHLRYWSEKRRYHFAKYVSNRFLTLVQNLLIGQNFRIIRAIGLSG